MPLLSPTPQFRDLCSFAVEIIGQAAKIDICYCKENKYFGSSCVKNVISALVNKLCTDEPGFGCSYALDRS